MYENIIHIHNIVFFSLNRINCVVIPCYFPKIAHQKKNNQNRAGVLAVCAAAGNITL